MRVADVFTVTNNFSERVCYWIFKTDDTSYWASYEGKWGWLGTGESARFDLNMGKVKIGFRKGEGSFDDWHASPVEVETNRPVELTDEKRIVQSSEKFPNPNESKSVNFVDDFIIKVDDIARMVVLAAIGKIPEVGLGVSAVVGFFWPVKEPTVDALIRNSEARMRGYVHGRIDELKRDNLNNALNGLRANIKAYEDADSPTERQTWLDASLSQFNMAQPYFVTTKQKYVPGTASLALSLATMHLMLLRERVLHAREIFGTDKVNPKHKAELTNSIKTYQDFIRDVAIPGEMKWREKMLEVKETGPDIIGQAGIVVRDHAAREVHSFTKSANRGRSGNHTVLFRYFKEQALNSYRVALEAGVGDPARLWTLLDPEQANARPIPLDRVIWVGPCSGLSFKANNEHGLEDSVKHEDRPGVIKRIVVREYNEIDYLKFIYDGHEGHGSGNQKGASNTRSKFRKAITSRASRRGGIGSWSASSSTSATARARRSMATAPAWDTTTRPPHTPATVSARYATTTEMARRQVLHSASRPCRTTTK